MGSTRKWYFNCRTEQCRFEVYRQNNKMVHGIYRVKGRDSRKKETYTEKSKTKFSNNSLTIEFREPFKPRRGRINCSLNDNGKWRWFGIQFLVKED